MTQTLWFGQTEQLHCRTAQPLATSVHQFDVNQMGRIHA